MSKIVDDLFKSALQNFGQPGYEPPKSLMDRPVITVFPALTEPSQPQVRAPAMGFASGAMNTGMPMLGLPQLGPGSSMMAPPTQPPVMSGVQPTTQAPQQGLDQLPPGMNAKDLLLL